MPGQSGGGGTREKYIKEKNAALARSLAGAKRQADTLNAERKTNAINKDNEAQGEYGKYRFRRNDSFGKDWDVNAKNRKNKAYDIVIKRAEKKFYGKELQDGTSMNYDYIDPKTKIQVNAG